MNFDLDDLQRDIKATARDLLASRSSLAAVRSAVEAGRDDAELWRELGELGWPGIGVAEEHGGQGLGFVGVCVLLEELGYALAPTPFLGSVLAAAAIQAAGTDEQRSRWLPELAAGRVAGAVAEASGGIADLVLDGSRPEVLVALDGDGLRLAGGDGLTLEPRETIDPTRRYARATLEQAEAMPGDAEVVADLARVALSAELTGIAQHALDLTVAYVKDRRQFGVPVGSFQAVAHRCARMLRSTEVARSTTYAAAWAADCDPQGLAGAAAVAKVAASDAGREVGASAIQAHGGVGFTWEADLHWFYKRAQLDAVAFGTAGTHRKRLVRSLAAAAS